MNPTSKIQGASPKVVLTDDFPEGPFDGRIVLHDSRPIDSHVQIKAIHMSRNAQIGGERSYVAFQSAFRPIPGHPYASTAAGTTVFIAGSEKFMLSVLGLINGQVG